MSEAIPEIVHRMTKISGDTKGERNIIEIRFDPYTSA